MCRGSSLVERRPEKAGVASSILAPGTTVSTQVLKVPIAHSGVFVAYGCEHVLPEYPRGTNTRGPVSVFVEYLITKEGSVKVLRTSGPMPFTTAAQSAIERWVYQPLWFENRSCEVVSRIEVRFDSEFAQSGMSH